MALTGASAMPLSSRLRAQAAMRSMVTGRSGPARPKRGAFFAREALESGELGLDLGPGRRVVDDDVDVPRAAAGLLVADRGRVAGRRRASRARPSSSKHWARLLV